jgi:hypothetical protein
LPTKHGIDGSVVFPLTDWLRWFGGYRQAFGTFQYNGRPIRTGFSATFAPSWEAALPCSSSRPTIPSNADTRVTAGLRFTWCCVDRR